MFVTLENSCDSCRRFCFLGYSALMEPCTTALTYLLTYSRVVWCTEQRIRCGAVSKWRHFRFPQHDRCQRLSIV